MNAPPLSTRPSNNPFDPLTDIVGLPKDHSAVSPPTINKTVSVMSNHQHRPGSLGVTNDSRIAQVKTFMSISSPQSTQPAQAQSNFHYHNHLQQQQQQQYQQYQQYQQQQHQQLQQQQQQRQQQLVLYNQLMQAQAYNTAIATQQAMAYQTAHHQLNSRSPRIAPTQPTQVVPFVNASMANPNPLYNPYVPGAVATQANMAVPAMQPDSVVKFQREQYRVKDRKPQHVGDDNCAFRPLIDDLKARIKSTTSE